MIAFDLQGLQSVGNAERGIARYITEVVKAIVAGERDPVDLFLWNDRFPLPARVRELGLGDRLHIEFLVMNPGGNSGVYLQNRFEIQIQEGVKTKHGMGAVINETESPYHLFAGIGKWNAYDIVFRAARFQGKRRGNLQTDRRPVEQGRRREGHVPVWR